MSSAMCWGRTMARPLGHLGSNPGASLFPHLGPVGPASPAMQDGAEVGSFVPLMSGTPAQRRQGPQGPKIDVAVSPGTPRTPADQPAGPCVSLPKCPENAEAAADGTRGTHRTRVSVGADAVRRRMARIARVMSCHVEVPTASVQEFTIQRTGIGATAASEALGQQDCTMSGATERGLQIEPRGSGTKYPPSCSSDQQIHPMLGSRCGCCKGHIWWASLHPTTDGTGIGPGWCCLTCHPPPPRVAILEVRT